MEKAQTISEKILSRQSSDSSTVFAGDRVDIRPNTVLSNEMLPMVTIAKFHQTGAKKVNQDISDNMLTILDHGGWGTTDKFVDLHQLTREFTANHGIELLDAGEGISHVVFHERGYVKPGYLVLGTDSHTVSHGAFNAFAMGIGASDLVELMVKGNTWLNVPETNLIHVDGELKNNVYSKSRSLWL